LADTVGQATEQRSGGEEKKTKLEDTPPPDTVGYRAGKHEQAGDDQRICVENPLKTRYSGMEIALNGRQGDVDDGHIHADYQQAHAADGEDEIGMGFFLVVVFSAVAAVGTSFVSDIKLRPSLLRLGAIL
jgi:hypothetical protein